MQHRARKRFGQNFLTCQNTIRKIIDAANISANSKVIEIGPGLGALTFQLLKKLAQLTVIEIDNDLVEYLSEKAQPLTSATLNIVHQDVLTVDISSLGTSLTVIGNLPYNISTPVLFHLIKHRDALSSLCFMLQQEVVDRIAATPNCKAYGRLSVMLQYYFHVEPLFTVPPDAFKPKPKVMSKVVRLTPRPDNHFDAVPFESLETIARLAFSHRRKTLKKNLTSKLSANVLQSLGIEPDRRAETLSIAEFVLLAKAITH